MTTTGSLGFDGFTLDLQRLSLSGANGEIRLRRKSFELLHFLLREAGRVVSKEELLEAVWPGATVGDESLAQCVSEVRRALGDVNKLIVKTVPRMGYLIDSIVSRSDTNRDNASILGPTTKLGNGTQPILNAASIAVLPFTNMSRIRDREYFADGITEDIIIELSKFPELLVISKTSTFQYKGKKIDARAIGRDLLVDYILEGSVRRIGQAVRITAQLVDAKTGIHRWADKYDAKLRNVLSVQDKVVGKIVTLLASHVTAAEAERTLLKPTTTWKAYDFFMRASGQYSVYLTSLKVDGLYKTRRLLEKTISIDENYARAYVMLANTYTTAWLNPLDDDYLKPQALDLAEALARKAVQLDPKSPQAHAQFGMVLTWRRKHEASLREFNVAKALNPNFGEWRLYAMALVCAGKPELAIALTKSRSRSDPYYPPFASAWLGLAYYLCRDYSKALPPLVEAVARSPNFRLARVCLAITYAQLGENRAAHAEAREVLRIEPKYTIEGTQRQLTFFKRSMDVEHFYDGLGKAGLPIS